jgi:hypothetical protein
LVWIASDGLYVEGLKKKKKPKPECKVFSIPLETLAKRENCEVPFVVNQMLLYLEKNCRVEGIFRIPGSQSQIEKLISRFDSG